MNATLGKIAAIIEETTGTPASNVTPATTFIDVSADSFEHIEILLEIERGFDLDLADDAVERVRNMGELAELVDALVARKQGRAA